MDSESKWTLDALKAYCDQRFDDQEKAVKAALASAERAVEKAEANSQRWQQNANEWRGSMLDREAKFATIATVEARFQGVEAILSDRAAQIASLSESRAAIAGTKAGMSTAQGVVTLIVSLIVSMIVIGGTVVGIAMAIRK